MGDVIGDQRNFHNVGLGNVQIKKDEMYRESTTHWTEMHAEFLEGKLERMGPLGRPRQR
jgi:hypothetical protein